MADKARVAQAGILIVKSGIPEARITQAGLIVVRSYDLVEPEPTEATNTAMMFLSM